MGLTPRFHSRGSRFGHRPGRDLEVSYVAATNGGGAFLFIYLGICLTLGLA